MKLISSVASRITFSPPPLFHEVEVYEEEQLEEEMQELFISDDAKAVVRPDDEDKDEEMGAEESGDAKAVVEEDEDAKAVVEENEEDEDEDDEDEDGIVEDAVIEGEDRIFGDAVLEDDENHEAENNAEGVRQDLWWLR